MSAGSKSATRRCGSGGIGLGRCSPLRSEENGFSNFVLIRTGNGIWTRLSDQFSYLHKITLYGESFPLNGRPRSAFGWKSPLDENCSNGSYGPEADMNRQLVKSH